jgi:hypothetical protein
MACYGDRFTAICGALKIPLLGNECATLGNLQTVIVLTGNSYEYKSLSFHCLTNPIKQAFIRGS